MPEFSPDGDPHDQREQHDFPGTRDEPADGSRGHQGFSTNQGDPQSDMTRGGGSQSNLGRLPIQHLRIRDARDQYPRGSQSSRNQPSQPSNSKNQIAGGGAISSNSRHNPIQQGNLRNSRDQNPRGSLCSRNPASQPSHPQKAILLTGPSNMATFGTLATTQLPDLHSMAAGQQTRTIPKQPNPQPEPQ